MPSNRNGTPIVGTDQNEAEIVSIVESVGTLADLGAFDLLGRLFADEFELDYSSLNGRAATTYTPAALMAEWAAVLPGFDRTRHALSNVSVHVLDETALASARAEVVASHWIGHQLWRVWGAYDYRLAKTDEHWHITSMTFQLHEEEGSREVFEPAMAAAARNSKSTTAIRNRTTVRTFFERLEQQDLAGFLGLFAVDGVQINPYHGGVFPTGAQGREQLREYWTPVMTDFERMHFEIHDLLTTEDANLLFVNYSGEIEVQKGASPYRNQYYSTFRFNEVGEITEYVEIFDPVVAAQAFGLLDQLGQDSEEVAPLDRPPLE